MRITTAFETHSEHRHELVYTQGKDKKKKHIQDPDSSQFYRMVEEASKDLAQGTQNGQANK